VDLQTTGTRLRRIGSNIDTHTTDRHVFINNVKHEREHCQRLKLHRNYFVDRCFHDCLLYVRNVFTW